MIIIRRHRRGGDALFPLGGWRRLDHGIQFAAKVVSRDNRTALIP